MKTAIKIVMIAMILLWNCNERDGVGAQTSKLDCDRLKGMLDQYAHLLFLGSPEQDGQPLELGSKRILEQLEQMNLPREMIAKTQSLMGSIHKCYGFAGSAQYGMGGFLTDLRFRMKKDAELREDCSHIEDQYKKLMQGCARELRE